MPCVTLNKSTCASLKLRLSAYLKTQASGKDVIGPIICLSMGRSAKSNAYFQTYLKVGRLLVSMTAFSSFGYVYRGIG